MPIYSTLISTEELARHLDDPEWVVIDCRFSLNDLAYGEKAYAESHIAGACYAHLDEDLSGPIVPGLTGRHPLPDVSAVVDTFSRWGIGSGVQVVSYDDMGGPFAARLWWMLRWLGHDAAAVLDGGWPAWVEAGFPTSASPCMPTRRTFESRIREKMLASAEDAAAAMNRNDVTLVDARAAERFAGRHEPIDPIVGHIPSAVCYPWAGNLDSKGRFLPAETLRARFTGMADSKDLLCYCGSGVTGAHNVLSIAHAGFPIPRLYAGSWSEWITDPDRPVATG